MSMEQARSFGSTHSSSVFASDDGTAGDGRFYSWQKLLTTSTSSTDSRTKRPLPLRLTFEHRGVCR
jgi:hypothetical protein